MSTEYRVKFRACPTCNCSPKPIIIGCASIGWKFGFEQYIELKISSWVDWQVYLGDKDIVDEYGESFTFEDFKSFVESKQSGIWGGTASPAIYGPISFDKYEYLDADGYRFWKEQI